MSIQHLYQNQQYASGKKRLLSNVILPVKTFYMLSQTHILYGYFNFKRQKKGKDARNEFFITENILCTSVYLPLNRYQLDMA